MINNKFRILLILSLIFVLIVGTLGTSYAGKLGTPSINAEIISCDGSTMTYTFDWENIVAKGYAVAIFKEGISSALLGENGSFKGRKGVTFPSGQEFTKDLTQNTLGISGPGTYTIKLRLYDNKNQIIYDVDSEPFIVYPIE